MTYAWESIQRRSRGSSASYVHRAKFKMLKKDKKEQGDWVCLYFMKKGSRKIFRVVLEYGTMVAIQFRRVYLLRVFDERVELRVVSIDGIAKYVNSKLNQ